MAERSKAPYVSEVLHEGVGSNPTSDKCFLLNRYCDYAEKLSGSQVMRMELVMRESE